MRVVQFAKRSVVTVALVSVTLAGCGSESTPDAPFNPVGTAADMAAMNSTFESPTFASFATFSLMFDAALGGQSIISNSAAALDLRGAGRGNAAALRAAMARSARRIAAIMPRPTANSFSASRMTIPSAAAGKTFVYDPVAGGYVASDLPLLPSNQVRFILYEVDPVTWQPLEPLVETGRVDLYDLSSGSTQAARVVVISGSTTYLDYTVTASSSPSTARITVLGYLTDGTTQANMNLRSVFTFTTGLTLGYSLDIPQRDVSIDLSLSASDPTDPSSPIVITLVMRGPNGTVAMSGQLTQTTATINVRISGEAFATLTTNGAEVTITRNDGTPLTDNEVQALTQVFEMSGEAGASFDQMLIPIGGLFGPPA